MPSEHAPCDLFPSLPFPGQLFCTSSSLQLLLCSHLYILYSLFNCFLSPVSFSPILLYPFSSRLNIFPTNLSHFSSVSSSFPTLSRPTLSYPRRLHLCSVRHPICVRSCDHALLCEGGHQHFLRRIRAHRESPVQRGGAELQDEHQHRSVRCDMM